MSPAPALDGGLIIDKPSGPTSHDVVAVARRALGERRIGHTGTLDPLATGVLVLLVGRATRLSQFLVGEDKEYLADVRLGVSTPTYDATSLGEAMREAGGAIGEGRGANGEGGGATDDHIEEVLGRFRGTFLQTPPAHSAKKVGGARAYESARRNEPVDLQPVEVTVRELEIIAPVAAPTEDPTRPSPLPVRPSLLRLRVVCSSGFYVRSLAHDLGQALGCGAHLEGLRRTRAGEFRIGQAISLDTLANDPEGARAALLPMNALLAAYAPITLSEEGARRAAHGNAVMPEHVAGRPAALAHDARVRLVDASGRLVAIAEARADLVLHPVTVLV